MIQRSLHAGTKVYYRSMSYFATDSPSKVPLAVLKIPHQRPLLHRVGKVFHKVCHPSMRGWMACGRYGGLRHGGGLNTGEVRVLGL
jgi:hypothetical protein